MGFLGDSGPELTPEDFRLLRDLVNGFCGILFAEDATFVKDTLAAYCDHELLPAMRAIAPDAAIVTHTIGEVEGLEPMGENESRRLVAELTGEETADVVSFGTEAGLFQSLGMSAVVCGPGSIEQAHKPDEFVSVEQLEACLGMLERLVGKLAK